MGIVCRAHGNGCSLALLLLRAAQKAQEVPVNAVVTSTHPAAEVFAGPSAAPYAWFGVERGLTYGFVNQSFLCQFSCMPKPRNITGVYTSATTQMGCGLVIVRMSFEFRAFFHFKKSHK